MKSAIDETNRRRAIQDEYNRKNGIVPKSVVKKVSDVISIGLTGGESTGRKGAPVKLTGAEKEKTIERLTAEMLAAAKELRFEEAAFLRDKINKLKGEGRSKKR